MTWTLALSLHLLGCGGGNEDPEGAEALLAQVRANDYRGWQRAPGYGQRRSTSAPHGEEVDIYVNPVVEAALRGGPASSWPEGSIIVKDGWEDSDLCIIAIMEKRADGWYWAEFDGDGDPDFSGRPEVCTDCHEDGSDFVLAFPLPR